MKLNRIAWTIVMAMGIGTGIAYATPEGNPKNGLSDWAFKQNSLLGNTDAIAALVSSNGLSSNTVAASTLNNQLHDGAARAVFTELVRCAFPSSYAILYTDPLDPHRQSYMFTGELGLCNGGWETGAPSASCQQIVSACIMSRVNAVNHAVPLSILPQTIAAAPTRLVPTETTYRENFAQTDPAAGATIAPFISSCGFGYDCGWQPAYVGTCGALLGNVTLKIKNASTCNTPIRVCDGLEGCIQPGTAWPIPDPETYPDATHVLGSTGSTCSTALTFTCPLSQTYSVMLKTSGSLPTVSVTNGNTGYPAKEPTVFSFREGAFYGNLFEATSSMPWTCQVDPAHPWGHGVEDEPLYCTSTGSPDFNAIPYQHAYACYSAGVERTGDSTSGASYMNSRMCSDPDGGYACFPHGLSRCWIKNSTAGKCLWDDDRGVFHDCVGDGVTYQAITTYLHNTCDLSAGGICTPNGSGGPPVIKRVDDDGAGDDDGGCSVGGSSGIAMLAAALVFVIRRRQRS